jgi:glycosyltransferase involved in cell wall biosynthesis
MQSGRPGASRSVLLDVTRLVSRVGAGPATGIDRVERAMLRGLLARDLNLRGLCRTAAGFVLLDRPALGTLDRQLDGAEPWGRADLAGRLSLRLTPARRAAEGAVRRAAWGRAGVRGLKALLAAELPPGTAYLNLGHSNLTDTVFDALGQVAGARAAVLIHDTIPLRLPATQAPGASRRFAARLAVAARHADVLFCPSRAERDHIAAALGPVPRPEIVVAPLGIDLPAPDHNALRAAGGAPGGPYFVAIGTIEPRKNIGLLLDLWDRLDRAPPPGGLPGLCLVGRRGWETPAFFRRLDALKARLPAVREFPDLSDGAKAALLAGARALLFPSRAEGYGLPPLEALSLGVPPVCAPLPVHAETLGDAAVYADPDDLYQWAGIVRDMADGDRQIVSGWTAPTWDDHVNLVLATIAQ